MSTEMENGAVEAANEPATDTRSPKREFRSFPRKTLADALKVVQAIKEQNAGKAFAPPQIADAIGRKPRSSDFGVILAAAQFYGMTEGGAKAAVISLTELGRSLAYPRTPQEEKEALIRSFLEVEIFKKVFSHYENNKLPEHKFLKNTLESEFKISKEHVDEFIEIFEGNLRFLNVDTAGYLAFQSSTDKDVVQDLAPDVASVRSVVRSGRSKAFVIMPFLERNPARPDGFFKEVYRSLIEPAAQQAGFDVDWANRAGSDLIQSTIINEVLDADLVIADLTDHNPNVLFELGLRFAHNKGPTALIKSQDTPRLFDVDNVMGVYEYKPTLWASSLSIDIPNMEQHIRATFEGRESGETYINILRRRRLGNAEG